MRVGISALTLVPGISGGSETYVRELVRALGRVGRHDYRVLLPTLAPDVEGLPAEVVTEYRASPSTPGRIFAMTRGRFLGGRLRRRYQGLDVVHFPLTVPVPRTSEPVVITLHDVQHLDHPEFFGRAERAFRSLAYDRSVQRADAVIVVSDFVGRRVTEHLGLDPQRVHAIPHGVDHARFRPGDAEREELLLYPAREWPHKNHARLFEAFAELRRRRPGLSLVLTSYDGLVPDGVRSLGRVSPAELARLYQTAAALVFPSLYEGFGQPPLEAMACGCPVACSNAASLPEVVGDAARLFDPTDVESIVAAIEDVLDDPGELVARGLARAARFTWDASARSHDEVYDSLAAYQY